MRWCQHTLGLALAYALSGGLVYLIRQPTDQAVVFWPAAGVAFHAVAMPETMPSKRPRTEWCGPGLPEFASAAES